MRNPYLSSGDVAEMTTQTTKKPIWGAKKIAEAIDRPVRATFNLLESKQIPAKKIGGRWCATPEGLDQFFADMSVSDTGAK
jgi:hypothetical protein